jgi:hypothetical protein
MHDQPARETIPVLSVEVDEVIEFTDVAENNPQATVKQRAAAAATNAPILATVVDEVIEFNETAVTTDAQANGASQAETDTHTEPAA